MVAQIVGLHRIRSLSIQYFTDNKRYSRK